MLGADPPPAPAASWAWPVPTLSILGRFERPEHRYGSGHRGLDLAAEAGQPVRAVADGEVIFAGEVGGVPTISVDHGDIRSTYQPVRAEVVVGERVRAGTVLGAVATTSSHCATSCLHLGARVGDDYADPLRLLVRRRAVLKPLDRAGLWGAPR